MRTYRINCVDEQDKVISTEEVMLADDLAAFDRAKELCTKSGVEIWEGERRVIWMRKGGAARIESILEAVAPPNSKSAQRAMDCAERTSS